LVPEPVIVEVDQLLRSRVGAHSARLFLAALSAREHTVAQLSPGLLRRAVEIDASFADLGLGYTDSAVMAIAERDQLPILTFDFEHFRAARPARGFWQLVIDEHRYHQHART
jgi:predicted nucleic acid-binding protein